MKLIRERRKRLHLSYDRAGQMVPGRISGTRWRQLEDGYRTIRDVGRVPESAPPVTLAGMAFVTGLSPDDLRGEGHDEAAEELVHLIEVRTRDDGETDAEAARMAGIAVGLNIRQQKWLTGRIASDLRQLREQD